MTDRSNGYRVSMTDVDVARVIIAAADAAGARNWRGFYLENVIASAVAAGRALGRRIPLEPLDDGLRDVAGWAADELSGQGHAGVHNLRRLHLFLQRYPARGIPDADGVPA